MTYAAAGLVQTALFTLLSGDATLAGLVPGGVFDAPPPATPQGTYVVIGQEEVIDRSDISGAGAEHRVTVEVVSNAQGFLTAKTAAARIDALLAGTPPALAQGRIVAVWFQDARARRSEGGDLRRLDLRYRIRIEI